jgi:WD40 repeat protein
LATIAAGTSNDLSAGSPTIIDTTIAGTFPSIYTASVTLSSNVVAATSVTATVAFTPATSAIIKTITIARTNFLTSAVISSTICTLNGATTNGAATVTWSSAVLVITLTSAFAGTSSTAISCPIAGLTNAAFSQAAKTVSITTLDTILDGAVTPAVIDHITGVAFPAIGTQTTSVAFTIASVDRIAAKANVSVTLSFTTSTALHFYFSTGKITLNYPAGFFAATPNPAPNAAGSTSVSYLIATSAISGNSIVITTPQFFSIAPNTAFTITLSGLTMGAATAGSATGVTVQTDTDTAASAGVASGGIASQTTGGITGPTITACPAGTFKTVSGSNTAAACTACPPGTYNPFSGSNSSSSCMLCPEGSYSASGQSTCTSSPTAISVHPISSLTGDSITVIGLNFILPEKIFQCTAKIGPIPSAGTPTNCQLLSSSRALVFVPLNVLIAPSFVQLLFEPGNVTTTAMTRFCPCVRSSGGVACGCALDSCGPNINVPVEPVTNVNISLVFAGHSGGVWYVAWSRDGTMIATASRDHTARIWHSGNGSLLNVLTGHSDQVYTVEWSPDGTKIATASRDGSVRVWSSSDGSALLTLTGHSGYVNSAAWSPDGTKIATASNDGTARVWNSNTGGALLTLTGHTAYVWSIAWSPDGTKLVTASTDSTARVWNGSTGSALLTLAGHNITKYVILVAMSPDGSKIATASSDGTARVWSTSSGNTLSIFTGHTDWVYGVAWSPDGSKIATASSDGTARVWNSNSGSLLHVLTGHSNYVYSVSWSPDGTKIATASNDGTARIWFIMVSPSNGMNSAPVASGRLGGQVKGVAFVIADADRVPLATGKQVTVSFTIENPLGAGDFVTLSYPSGFFGTYSVASVYPPPLFGAAPGITRLVLTVAAAQIIHAAALTITLSGLTMGALFPGNATGITVSTSKDAQSAGVPSGRIGGQVTDVAFVIADADRVPSAGNKQVTVSFTIQTALVSSDRITITYPNYFFQSGTSLSVNPAPPFMVQVSSIGNSWSLPVASGQSVAAGRVTITLSGVQMGGPSLGSATGITVSTSKDAQSAGVPSGRIGGQVTDVAFVIADADRVPSAGNKQVTVSFTIQTALVSGDRININYPPNFFQPYFFQPYTTPFVAPSTLFMTDNLRMDYFYLYLQVASGQSVAAGRVTITLSGVQMGGPSLGSATGITVSTSKDAQSAGVPSGRIGGGSQVTDVAFVIADADRVPGASNKQVTVSFTIQTALVSGDRITINYPNYFFQSGTSLSVNPAPTYNASVSLQLDPNENSVGLPVASGQSVAAGRVTITLSGVQMGGPSLGSATGITVSTSKDAQSAGVPSGRIGGQVTDVAFVIADADRVPGASNKQVTVSFTIQTALVSDDLITINYPNYFFQSGTSLSVNPAPPLVPQSYSQSNYVSLPVASGQAVAAGRVTITLSGVQMGGPSLSSATGITVSTSKDMQSAGVPSGRIFGGQVTDVAFVIADADRVAYASNKQVTVSFTIQTALVSGDRITINYPYNFLVRGYHPIHAPYEAVQSVTPAPPFTAQTSLEWNHANLQVASGQSVAAGRVTITLSGVQMGGTSLGSATGIMVETSKDFRSEGVPSGRIV